MKIVVIAATTNLDLHNEQFTEEQLIKLAESSMNVPVGVDFDPRVPPIGKVVAAWVKKEKLWLEIELNQNATSYINPELSSDGYIVPGFRSDLAGENIEAITYSLVAAPADSSLVNISENFS